MESPIQPLSSHEKAYDSSFSSVKKCPASGMVYIFKREWPRPPWSWLTRLIDIIWDADRVCVQVCKTDRAHALFFFLFFTINSLQWFDIVEARVVGITAHYHGTGFITITISRLLVLNNAANWLGWLFCGRMGAAWAGWNSGWLGCPWTWWNLDQRMDFSDAGIYVKHYKDVGPLLATYICAYNISSVTGRSRCYF